MDGLGICWLGADATRACEFLERSLALQREAKIELRFAGISAKLVSIYCGLYQFAQAQRVFAVGLPFAAERDLDHIQAFMEGWQALIVMHQGRWAEATELANQSLRRAPSSQVPALVALGRVRARRGDIASAEHGPRYWP